jgi:hypothetical protein
MTSYAKPALAISGYTCAVEHSTGDRSLTLYLPVVALTPDGNYGAYVAAVLDQRGNLKAVTELGRKYSIIATPMPL